MATPFSTRMTARRAAQTLMGSYDALSTSRGACIAVHCGGSSPATRACCMHPASDLPYRDAALWADMDIPGYAEAVTATASISSSSRSEEHTSELQSLRHLVCRLL